MVVGSSSRKQKAVQENDEGLDVEENIDVESEEEEIMVNFEAMMGKREREMLHYHMITTKMIMLGLEKMIRASTFTLHFTLCFYHFLILNFLMSVFGVGNWLLYELMKLF